MSATAGGPNHSNTEFLSQTTGNSVLLRVSGWAAVALLAVACGAGAPPAPAVTPTIDVTEAAAVQDVRQTFAAYRAAVASGAAETAIDLVTPATLAEFSEIGEAARTASAEEVRALPATAQLLVLTLRSQTRPQDLALLQTGEDVLRFVVAGGYGGQDRSIGDLGAIELVDEDVAVGVVLTPAGEATPLRWRFERVAGSWRFDLLTAHRLNDDAIAAAARRGGTDVTAVVRQTLERLTGRPVDDALYEPSG